MTLWDAFRDGKIKIVPTTEVSAVGCNVSDIEYSISFGIPQSANLSTIIQRWGRAGRSRDGAGTCLLLVPPWAFLLENRPQGSRIQNLRGTQVALEPKSAPAKRGRLHADLVDFINVRAGATEEKGEQHM